MSAGKGGGGDMGNLFDLLNEAKKGVEAERKQQIDTEAERKEKAARDLREREEARRREEAQKKLIEENRRRNEALAKRDRIEGERKINPTAPHMRATDQGPTAPAPVLPAPAPKKLSKLVIAAMVVCGIGVGVGGAFALAPASHGAFLDVDLAAQSIVRQTARAASAEKRIQDELAKVRTQLNDLEQQFGGAGSEAKTLRADLASTRKALDEARAELTALKEAQANPTKPGGPRRPNPNPGTGLPSLNPNVFK